MLYVKRIASPGSMHDAGCSGMVHWDDPEGWYVEGGGRELSPTEKAMAPHSSTLAWKIPWTEEPEGLQTMGSLRVGHD